MDGFLVFVFGIMLFFAIIILIRMFGAWMFRINEVIYELKDIKELLRKKNE